MNRLLEQIKLLEGYRSKPYWDHKQWSVGYGTRASGPNDRVNRPQALQRLQSRIQQDIDAVSRFAPNAPQGTRDALASLSYNAGTGWMKKPLGRHVKAGNWDAAKHSFLQYNKASGKTNSGLVRRRATEAGWFGVGTTPQTSRMPAPQTSQWSMSALRSGRLDDMGRNSQIDNPLEPVPFDSADLNPEPWWKQYVNNEMKPASEAPQTQQAPQAPIGPSFNVQDIPKAPPPQNGSHFQGRFVTAAAPSPAKKPQQAGWDWNGGDWRIKWGNGKMTGMG